MKKNILHFSGLFIMVLFSGVSLAQTTLAEDQNPDYWVSRDKYMKMADSINAWHSTTPQETYKAIDFLADRREAREQRRTFRQQLRWERARNNWYYDDDYNNNYYSPYHNNYNYYRPYRYRAGFRNDNFYRNSLPLALTLGWLWCR